MLIFVNPALQTCARWREICLAGKQMRQYFLMMGVGQTTVRLS
jgi:hypothetical protein